MSEWDYTGTLWIRLYRSAFCYCLRFGYETVIVSTLSELEEVAREVIGTPVIWNVFAETTLKGWGCYKLLFDSDQEVLSKARRILRK